MRTTNVYIILNEETLGVVSSDGKTRKFKTFKEANAFASEILEVWTIIHVAFEHKWIQHKV